MTTTAFTRIKGSVTAPLGFRAAGVAAGIKSNGRKDLALIVSDTPASAAAVFTTNKVKAAPVQFNLRRVTSGTACAIVANSGNANACTGPTGLLHARATAVAVARRIGCAEGQVFVCSTGRIGVRLPIVKIELGIKQLLGSLSPTGDHAAAEAIMTSDTFPKECAVRLKLGGRTVHIGGLAKGAGMIEPHLATMLCFLTTDAAVAPGRLQRALAAAVAQSFNRISVDGDMSTNDTVLLLANGAAGTKPLTGRALAGFQAALNHVTLELAQMIVRDGEGATRFVTITVTGAADKHDAELATRAVANSLLVKTSWCGGDPNWGRIMDAIGYSHARVSEQRVDIAYDGLTAVRGGVAARVSPARLKAVLARPAFTVTVNLHRGRGRATVYTCDVSEKYVELNKGE